MHEFVEHRTSYFSKYSDKLSFRFPSFKIALNILLQTSPHDRVVLETGSQSEKDNWGAGCSTMIFAEFCHRYGGAVHTVDISQDVTGKCKRATQEFEDMIEYNTGDSIGFLACFQRKVDLLYLDSYDYPIGIENGNIVLVGDPAPSQQHILNEAKTGLPLLKESSVVLIDDSNCPGGGKGGLAVPFLEQNGWMVVFDLQQTVLIRSKT